MGGGQSQPQRPLLRGRGEGPSPPAMGGGRHRVQQPPSPPEAPAAPAGKGRERRAGRSLFSVRKAGGFLLSVWGRPPLLPAKLANKFHVGPGDLPELPPAASEGGARGLIPCKGLPSSPPRGSPAGALPPPPPTPRCALPPAGALGEGEGRRDAAAPPLWRRRGRGARAWEGAGEGRFPPERGGPLGGGASAAACLTRELLSRVNAPACTHTGGRAREPLHFPEQRGRPRHGLGRESSEEPPGRPSPPLHNLHFLQGHQMTSKTAIM